MVIIRDLKHCGLPANNALAQRILRAQKATKGIRPPAVDTTGLNLPPWIKPQTLGMMGMGGTTERFTPEEIQRTKLFLSIISEAVDIARSQKGVTSQHKYFRPEALLKIARAMAQMGETEEALEIINGVYNDILKVWRFLPSQPEATAEIDVSERLKYVRKFKPHGTRAEELLTIGGRLARAGKIDEAVIIINEEARASARKLARPCRRCEIQLRIASTLAAMGKTGEARDCCREISDNCSRKIALIRIAFALLQLGKVEEIPQVIEDAYEAARGVETAYIRKDFLAEVEKAAALIGEIKEIQAIVQKTKDASKILPEGDTAAARLEEINTALIDARKNDDPLNRIEALLGVAKFLFEADPQIMSEERIELLEEQESQQEALRAQAKAAEETEKAERIRQEAEQSRQEAERRAERRRGREEATLLELSNENPDIKRAALRRYLDWGLHDPRAREPLAEALKTEGKIELASALAVVDPEMADKIIVELLKTQMDRMVDFEILTRSFRLPFTAALIERTKEAQRKGEALRESLREKIEEITAAVIKKIGAVLELKSDHAASASEGNRGSYGSITMRAGLSLRLEQRLELKQELLPRDVLDIETGESIEDIKERMRTLNFLVHHEMGHSIQRKRKIEHPAISLFPSLDQKEAKHHANEILIDKLAFDAARKIYVHGDGDILFTENAREAIAIDAYLTLGRIVLRNLEAGVHALPDECLARIIAVLREISKSNSIPAKTKSELSGLADTFMTRIASEKIAEIDALIAAYRKIFRTTQLEI